MDQKTTFILNLGKYGGYIAVLWVAVSQSGFMIAGPLAPFMFLFALDNIRTYYLDEKLPSLSIPSLYIQLIFAMVFIYLDGSTVGGILLIILIAESRIAYASPLGENIFFLSLTGFPAVSALSLDHRAALNWENMAAVFINTLFFVFAYAVSYMARRQLEERERAEKALEQLDRSRNDLENAYLKLIEVSKQRELLAAVEERSRLGRELHDTLAHTLTAIVVSLEAGKKLFDQDPQRALTEISKSQEQARSGLDEVRRTVKALRPANLDKMDFKAAVNSFARDFSGSEMKIVFELDEDLELTPAVETVFYRIIQESITNSVRHGKATQVIVRLWKDEETLNLTVTDNGKGCNDIEEGYGLQGIRERALSLNGHVSFICRVSGGFTVNVTLEGKR
jgi:signal transduction histidine kinase